MIPRHIKKILSGIYDVLTLEDLFPHRIRRIVFQMFGSASLVLIIVLIFGGESSDSGIKGGAFVCVAITLFLFTLESYFYSIVIDSRQKFFVSFDIGELLYYSDNDDLTSALFFSDLGDEGMHRLGFSEDEIKDFLVSRNHTPFVGVFDSVTNHIYAEDYFKLIYCNDSELRDMLKTKDINESEFVGAMLWVINRNRKVIERERFWSRDNLSKIKGLGKRWSYGGTYTLDEYGIDLTESQYEFDEAYLKSKEKVLSRLESILTRPHGSNVVIISDDESSRIDIVTMLAQMIGYSGSHAHLQHKRVFLMDPNLVIQKNNDKELLEREIGIILTEAERAQDVILIIPELSLFIKNASQVGVDTNMILSPYIHSPYVHIVGLDSKERYHSFLNQRSSISENFEILDTDENDNSSLTTMLLDEIEKIETKTKVLVTYPAAVAILDFVRKSEKEGDRANKSKVMLVELVDLALQQNRVDVQKKDVLLLTDEAPISGKK